LSSNLFFKITTLFLFLIANVGIAQTSEIVIKVKNKPEILIPGKHYTVLFEIFNNSNSAANLTFDYKLPLGFNLIFSKENKIIPPKNKKIILITFSIAKNCKADSYFLGVNVFENKILLANEKITFEVSKLYKLIIEPLKYPEYLMFEKDFTCEYLITNKGNSEEKINFHSDRGISIHPTLVFLKPDSSIVVKVNQSVPFSPFNKTTVLSSLKALVISKDTIFSNRIPITVYPNSTKKPDLYHRFPISVATIVNSLRGNESIDVVKFKVNGGGFLDRNDKHYLSFLYSGPNQIDLARFGEYDQYNVQYKNKKLAIMAGDVSYTLSNLTEASRSGLGGVFNYKFPKYSVSLFYLSPRFSDKIKDSYGGKLTYFLSDKTLIDVGFIDRTLFENNESFKSQIYNISSKFSTKYLKLRGEVAFENNYASNGFGFSIESFLNAKKLNWGNSIQYSDKNFKGYLRNSKQLLTYINYSFSNKISAQVNANYRSINPEKDNINYNSSPIIINYQGSLNYKINRNNKLKLGGGFRKKEDRFTPKNFNFEEKLVFLNYYNRKKNGYNLNITNRYGTSINLLADDISSKNVFFSTIDFSVEIFKNVVAGLSGDYERTNKNSVNNELNNTLYYGGNLQYNLNNKLHLNLFYRNDYALDELEIDAQSFLEAQIDFNYNRNHKFSLSASKTSLPSGNESLNDEFFITATYNFIVNTPLSKDKTVGTLKGKIVSTENDNIDGILISLGEKATVTNNKGEFIFYNLKPNEYLLNVSQSSLPSDKIIIENLPYKIDVIPNKETEIVLNLGKTGNLEGTIKLKKIRGIRSSQFDKKLPNIIVKIYNKDKKYLTKTNGLGNFKFAKLSPGEWTVELIVKRLSKDFTFDKIKTTVQISPDKNIFITFNANSKNRMIKKSKKTFKL